MSAADTFGGIGALFGQRAADRDRARARGLLRENIADWQGLDIPTLDEQRVAAEQTGATGYEDVGVDPRLRDAQMGALTQLQQESSRGGMGVEDLAAVRQAEDETDRRSRMARMAVLDRMRATGMSGSGAELAAQLQGEQAAAQTRSQAGLQAAADARRRALAAAEATGTLGGRMEGEDTRRQEARAAARDRIAQFNANNRTRANEYNSGLYQTQFGNQVTRTQGVTGSRNNLANAYNGQAAANVATGTAAGGVVGGAIDAGISAYTGVPIPDKNKKGGQ